MENLQTIALYGPAELDESLVDTAVGEGISVINTLLDRMLIEKSIVNSDIIGQFGLFDFAVYDDEKEANEGYVGIDLKDVKAFVEDRVKAFLEFWKGHSGLNIRKYVLPTRQKDFEGNEVMVMAFSTREAYSNITSPAYTFTSAAALGFGEVFGVSIAEESL